MSRDIFGPKASTMICVDGGAAASEEWTLARIGKGGAKTHRVLVLRDEAGKIRDVRTFCKTRNRRLAWNLDVEVFAGEDCRKATCENCKPTIMTWNPYV